MDPTIEKTLPQLRNKRDFRAAILSLAAELFGNSRKGRIIVHDPLVSAASLSKDWEFLRWVLLPEIRERMDVMIETDPAGARPEARLTNDSWLLRQIAKDHIKIDRPNYRYEVLRLLLDAHLARRPTPTLVQLITTIGASQTPIRDAMDKLKRAGVLTPWRRELHLDLDAMTQESLAKVRALPQVLRFRYAAGSAPKPQATLLQRARQLLQMRASNGWKIFALSGVPVAHDDVPELDLLGIPRLDLTAHVPRQASNFNAGWLRQLDDGLEPESNILAPAPVAVTLVRGQDHFDRTGSSGPADQATRADVFFSLLDQGLRGQALQYAKHRP